jgi:predicted nucleic acid-binding protein
MGELTSLVDTSVLIGAFEVVDAEKRGTWSVSVVTIGELYAGVRLAEHDEEQSLRLKRLAAVLDLAEVLDIDRSVATGYGDLRTLSKRSPSNDLWIAGTALAHDLELVTMDVAQAALPLVRTQLI